MTMAINSTGILRDNNTKSLCSSNTSNLSSCRLIKINFAGKDINSNGLHSQIKTNKEAKSPYLSGDKVQLLSRVTDKRLVHKKPVNSDFTSSFPLAVNVYKANSDEFKLSKRSNKKVKKSVLTLPNAPAPIPKTYTVSDMNDSEYLEDTNDKRPVKTKKRRPIKRNKKFRIKDEEMEFYDRDARYCSQLNINLDCSSTDLVNFTGDGGRGSNKSYKTKSPLKISNDPHNVWAMLRNINRLQFRPSPPASQESVVPLRKRRPAIRKGGNRNDTRIIETCRTEEFAYISSFEIDSKSQDSYSPSSSFDRITVIDKQDEQDDIVQQFNNQNIKEYPKLASRGKNNINQYPLKNKGRLRNTNKRTSYDKQKNFNHHQEKNDGFSHEGNKIDMVNVPEHLIGLQATTEVKSCTSIHLESIHDSNCSIIKEDKQLYSKNINVSTTGERLGDNKVKSNNPKHVTKTLITKGKIPHIKEESEQQINGITKVILSKGRVMDPSKVVEQHKNPCVALTLPNTSLPKLTQSEIKRRLANMKFPIVVLEKDQLTNRAIHVPKYDPPQFDGLSEHIWPFMLEWPREPETEDDIKSRQKLKKKDGNSDFHFQRGLQNICLKEPKLVDVSLTNKADKNKIRNLATDRNTPVFYKESSAVITKTKPLRLFQNRMLKFLHKNSSPTKITQYYDGQDPVVKIDKIVGTNEKLSNEVNKLDRKSQECLLAKETNRKTTTNTIEKKPCSLVKHPWAKTKWASDFIDNIIRKIKCGVYYGMDHSEIKYKIKATEASTQTEKHIFRNAFCQKEADTELVSKLVTNTKDDPLKNILGFDNTLTTFEIETVTNNKISVKHCVTNVVVQFDVQVLAEANNIVHGDNSLSCIPIDSTEHPERVFKCKTRILNAILPAELCRIIPTMMQSIIDSNVTLGVPIKPVEKLNSSLTAVTELPRSEINSVSPLILPVYKVPQKVGSIMAGRFSIINGLKYEMNKIIEFTPKFQIESLINLIPNLNIQTLLKCSYGRSDLQVHTNKEIAMTTCILEDSKPIYNSGKKQIPYCMALQPYEPKKHSLIASHTFNTRNFLKEFFIKLNSNIGMLLYSDSCHITCYFYTITYNFNDIIVSQDQAGNKDLNRNNPELLSLYNAFAKGNDAPLDSLVQTTKIGTHIKYEKCSNDNCKKQTNNRNVKKSRYIKRYRKCNSMSSISNYKSTPLSRVTNIDEFCQVLGSNSLCSVFDGCLKKKILSAVAEMRNYVTEITPKQALLVLLLTNKKESSNLIRFKSVLLQGIAVNRITRAVELDTEIDVIEREKFYKFSQYEEFSSPLAFHDNQNNLLEELFWIAKTTASDHQKPFDESSEKLLKSLLEKRKKLNPSYLRVMARYVGLGLLKHVK